MPKERSVWCEKLRRKLGTEEQRGGHRRVSQKGARRWVRAGKDGGCQGEEGPMAPSVWGQTVCPTRCREVSRLQGGKEASGDLAEPRREARSGLGRGMNGGEAMEVTGGAGERAAGREAGCRGERCPLKR